MAFVTGYSANIGFGFTTLNNWSNRSKRARCFLKKKRAVRWSHPRKTKTDLDLDLNHNIYFVTCTGDLQNAQNMLRQNETHNYFELVQLFRCKRH